MIMFLQRLNTPIRYDRAFYKKGNKSFYPNSNNIKKRTQDLNRYFHDAGQFYIGQVSSWINEKRFFQINQNL